MGPNGLEVKAEEKRRVPSAHIPTATAALTTMSATEAAAGGAAAAVAAATTANSLPAVAECKGEA